MHACFNYLSARSHLYSLLCGHTVAGVENGCCRNGPEHGHVLQAHQRWAFFSCRTITASFIFNTQKRINVRSIWCSDACRSKCTCSALPVLVLCSQLPGKTRRERREGQATSCKARGGSEGRHRIRGNTRIANTSRPHIYLLGDAVEKRVRGINR